MAGRRLILLSGLWIGGCTEPPPSPPPDPLQRKLDIAREQMHQTREVIRYMEIEQRLQQEMRDPLKAPADASPTATESTAKE